MLNTFVENCGSLWYDRLLVILLIYNIVEYVESVERKVLRFYHVRHFQKISTYFPKQVLTIQIKNVRDLHFRKSGYIVI